MPKMPSVISKKLNEVKNNLAKGAQQTLIEELFNDYYKNRWKIYQVNFFRGIFFGFGSIIGATILVGLAIWILSLFTDLPFVGNYAEQSQDSIENRPQR